MNKRKLLLILACGCILTACNTEVSDVEGTSAQVENATNVTETETAEMESAKSENAASESVASSEASASEEKQEVHRIIVKSYDTQDGQKITDVVTDITEQTFDGQGNMVLEEIYGGKNGDDLKKRTTYTYDEKGNLLHSEEEWHEGIKKTRNRILEYEYDDKNQKIKGVLVATEEGQKDTTYLYSYDEDGKLVEQQRLQEGEVREIVNYK